MTRREPAEKVQRAGITFVGSHYEPMLSLARVVATKAVVIYGRRVALLGSLSKPSLSFLRVAAIEVEGVHDSDFAQ